MAAITVEELREALPPGTDLLGGAAGLGRSVSGTATFRARTPAFPALHGGELAIVPLGLLRQVDPQTHLHLDRLVTQLAGAGIAAIVLVGDGVAGQGPGQAREAMAVGSGAAASAAAEAHAIPLFITPAATTAEQIDLALHRHLAGQRATLLRRSQQLQQEFAQLALSGSGPAEIVERLAVVAGCPAAWEVAKSLQPVAWALPDAAWTPPKELARSAAELPTILRAARLPLQRWSASANGALDSGEVAVLPLRADVGERGVGAAAGAGGTGGRTNGVGAWRRLVVAVRTGEETAGFLSLIAREGGGVGGGGASEGRLALSAASLAVSIALMRTRTASEAQGSALAGLVHDWLSGRLAGDALEARAGQLGLPLEPPYAVVLFEMGDALEPDDARPLAGALGVAGTPLVAAMGGMLRALLVPVPSDETLAAAAVSLHTVLAQRAADGVEAQGAVFAGIGRVATTAADVPRAFDEARQALAVARRLGGAHRVAYFGTLGVYRVLASTDAADLAAFRAETLGPLLGTDERGGADLLRTLEAYLACGGSPQETAQRLHTHRNTVLYRLQRIGDLLGLDVRAPETQFTLWLALRAGDVLGESAAGPQATVSGAGAAVVGTAAKGTSARRARAA